MLHDGEEANAHFLQLGGPKKLLMINHFPAERVKPNQLIKANSTHHGERSFQG